MTHILYLDPPNKMLSPKTKQLSLSKRIRLIDFPKISPTTQPHKVTAMAWHLSLNYALIETMKYISRSGVLTSSPPMLPMPLAR